MRYDVSSYRDNGRGRRRAPIAVSTILPTPARRRNHDVAARGFRFPLPSSAARSSHESPPSPEGLDANACDNENSMDTQLLRRAFSVDEFHRMAEAGVFGEEDRLELLAGEIVRMTPIGSHHAGCVKRLTSQLTAAVGTHALGSAWVRSRLTLVRTWKILLIGQFMNICVPGRAGDVAQSSPYGLSARTMSLSASRQTISGGVRRSPRPRRVHGARPTRRRMSRT